MDGAAGADSWSTDGHKWLNVPYDSGYAFVADARAHFASMTHRSSYMMHEGDARDQVDYNPEWSRRARGIASYAAIRQLGRRGVSDLVDRCCSHARSLVKCIGGLHGAEAVWEPVINQGLVRFRDERRRATDADHDSHTDRVIEQILAEGDAFFAESPSAAGAACGSQSRTADDGRRRRSCRRRRGPRYSPRIAMMGSTSAARRAGTSAAARATSARRIGTATNVGTSIACTP